MSENTDDMKKLMEDIGPVDPMEVMQAFLDVQPDEPLDFMADIEEFHLKFDLPFLGKPRMLPQDLFDFRTRFIQEEHDEYMVPQETLTTEKDLAPLFLDEGIVREALAHQLDALVDLTYVVLGTAYLQFGPDIFREAWRRVQAANMAKIRKLRADGTETDSGRAPTYDVVKPEGWIAPDHTDLVEDYEI